MSNSIIFSSLCVVPGPEVAVWSSNIIFSSLCVVPGPEVAVCPIVSYLVLCVLSQVLR